MPTYIKMGHEPRNKSKLTNKAWLINRRGTVVVVRYGCAELSGHTYKKIHWNKGYPSIVSNDFETIEDAKLYIHQQRLRRENHGYTLTKAKIYKHKL